MDAFEKVGAKAVVMSDPPPCAFTATWRKLGNTGNYASLPLLESNSLPRDPALGKARKTQPSADRIVSSPF
jgi:hypothetical protein